MSFGSKRLRRFSRPDCHLIEPLEERRLLSLAINLQVDGIDPSSPVQDPASITSPNAIYNPQVGTVYDISIWGVVHGSDSTGTNDTLGLVFGSWLSSNIRMGAVLGNIAVPTMEPYFNNTDASGGTQQDLDGDGDLDVGSNNPGSADGYFAALTPIFGGGSETLPPHNLIGEGSPGAGQSIEIATSTFTVTSISNGPPTTLQFQVRPQNGPGYVSALWDEDGAAVSTNSSEGTAGSVLSGAGVSITVPDTLPPTASTTLSPILGSSGNYQFTVNYIDNQALKTSTFTNNNNAILVTGPNGYSQFAQYVSETDTDPSVDPYAPWNVVYQIAPPTGDSAWGVASDGSFDPSGNGTYTFTLEPNQITDNASPTPNVAAQATVGTMDVNFTGVVSIAPATSSVNENSTTPVTFTVSRTDGLNDNFAEAVMVNYTVNSSSTAVAGTNYEALSGTVTIPAGQSSAVISVQSMDDNVVDNDTTLELDLAQGSSYVLGTSNLSSRLTIANTDTVAASVADLSIDRASTDQTATFTVTLSGTAQKDILIDYSTADGTAVAGTDYTAANGVLTIPAGQTTGEISVTILGSTNTGDRMFNLDISADPQSLSDLTFTNTTAVGTIADIIPAALNPTSVTAVPGLSGGAATFTVTLANAPLEPVTVTYATADGTAVAGTDYTATSGTLTFNAGQTSQTVSVPLLSIIRSDAGKTFTLTITADSLTSVDPSVATATATLLTPSFTELSINPKKGTPYIDSKGNKVTVKVSGVSSSFIGNILFPTGGPTTGVDALGIILDGTTSKSVLTVTTKSSSIAFIDVNGSLKSINAKKLSIGQASSQSPGTYIKTTGTLTTLAIGNLSSATVTSSFVKTITAGNMTGSSLNISGNTAAKMTVKNIQDSEITDSASLSSFNLAQWLNTDSTADLLSVAGMNTMTCKGNFQAAVSAGILGTVSIKKTWSNSLFVITSVKKMSVGGASNSALYASSNPNAAFPPTSSDLAAGGQVTTFTVTSKAANAFSASKIVAQFMGTIVLGSVTPNNNGSAFGVASEGIKAISGGDSKGGFNLKSLSNAQPGAAVSDGDFVIDLIST